MICPHCKTSLADDVTTCPSCGGDIHAVDVAPEFIFCEGCGARLSGEDRSCPKCGRPAPGILSQNSAASDLAAGKTASFPRITSEMLEDLVPEPADADPCDQLASHVDEQDTSVLNTSDFAASDASKQGGGTSRGASRKPMPAPSEPQDGHDPYAKPRRGKWIVAAAAVALLAGGAWFVTADPLGVMPGLMESFDKAASEMYPSRQTPEDASEGDGGEKGVEDEKDEDGASKDDLSDKTLSEAEAFQRLSAAYARIVSFQDEIGPVVDTYNGQYLAKDCAQRQEASKSAYVLRDSVQKVIDDLKGMTLAKDTAYAQDVEHLIQLATWMYNRVDVLCRSWDISLGLPEGERPIDHQDEILRPLREVEMVNGRAIDVVEYEQNVGAWKPVEKK